LEKTARTRSKSASAVRLRQAQSSVHLEKVVDTPCFLLLRLFKSFVAKLSEHHY
jgi:hypothetical protein